MGFRIVDKDDLAGTLQRLSQIRFDAVVLNNMRQIYNRGKSEGGTPVSTKATRPKGPHGELRQSLHRSGDEVGYTKSYAPHVEFGHRTVNGGYVQGQHFLKNNVDKQKPIFVEDLKREIRKILC